MMWPFLLFNARKNSSSSPAGWYQFILKTSFPYLFTEHTSVCLCFLDPFLSRPPDTDDDVTDDEELPLDDLRSEPPAAAAPMVVVVTFDEVERRLSDEEELGDFDAGLRLGELRTVSALLSTLCVFFNTCDELGFANVRLSVSVWMNLLI